MSVANPASRPIGAAFLNRQAQRLMDVILHLGAHRTATTTFQRYTRDQRDDLAAAGVAFWSPWKSRKVIFPGLFRKTVARKGRNVARRAEGRVRMFTTEAAAQGTHAILVSDENLLGTPAESLRRASLYPAAGERTARVAQAFGPQLRRIVLCIRSQDLWWASLCAFALTRGHPVPDPARLYAMSKSTRTWRDVITDIACAAPEAEIRVMPFETYGGRPDRVLAAALDQTARPDGQNHWLNASPDLRKLRSDLASQGRDPDILPDGTGRWQPFDAIQIARLRENYADDMHWLTAGADGLATLTEELTPTRADPSPSAEVRRKGHLDDTSQGQLAQDG